MPRHLVQIDRLYVYLMIAVIVILAVFGTAAAVAVRHSDQQKHHWHDEYAATHARFEEHMHCMGAAHCDSMRIAPHARVAD